MADFVFSVAEYLGVKREDGEFEVLFNNDVPVKAAINEAVELGKIYGSDSTPRFVNGVLGSLVSKYDEYKGTIEKMIAS